MGKFHFGNGKHYDKIPLQFHTLITWLIHLSIHSEWGWISQAKFDNREPTTVMLWKYIPEVPREWTWNWIWNNGLIQNWKMRTSRLFVSSCLFNLYAEYIMQNAYWMKHKLESRVSGEISITSDTQMIPPLWQKVKRNYRASWWRWKRRVKRLP